MKTDVQINKILQTALKVNTESSCMPRSIGAEARRIAQKIISIINSELKDPQLRIRYLGMETQILQKLLNKLEQYKGQEEQAKGDNCILPPLFGSTDNIIQVSGNLRPRTMHCYGDKSSSSSMASFIFRHVEEIEAAAVAPAAPAAPAPVEVAAPAEAAVPLAEAAASAAEVAAPAEAVALVGNRVMFRAVGGRILKSPQ